MIVISSAVALSEVTASTDNGVILYDNLVATSSVTATDQDVDHPAINLANPATHLFWRSNGVLTTEFIQATFSEQQSVNAFGIARHNLGTIGAFITVFGQTSAPGDSPVVFVTLSESRSLPDDAPFLSVFESQAVYSVLVGLSLLAATPAPEIGVMYAGQSLSLERSIKIDVGHTPITMGRTSRVINGRSESGNFLGRILVNEFRQGRADFAWFTPAWYRANFDPFIVASKQTPFFYAWHPSEYPLEVGYVWMMEDPIPEVDPVTQRIAVVLKYQGIA